jgi:hypothetical protein
MAQRDSAPDLPELAFDHPERMFDPRLDDAGLHPPELLGECLDRLGRG